MRQVDDVIELIWEDLAGEGRAEGAADAAAADDLPVWLTAGSVARSGDTRRPAGPGSTPSRGTPPAAS